jgi:hypothetical protein
MPTFVRRALIVLVIICVAASVGFVGGIVASGSEFNLFGFGTIKQSVESQLRVNQSAIDANNSAMDLIDRARNRGNR